MQRSRACAARRCWRWGNTTQWKGWSRTAEPAEVSASPTPLEAADVQAVACGTHHSAYVDAQGDLYTFGSPNYARLGHSGDGKTPLKVDLPEPVVSASLGGYHSAAIGASGTLYTWGWGGSFFSGASACGHGSSGDTLTPQAVSKLVEIGEKITQVSCGEQHTLAIGESGNVYAWGKGEYGRLGQGDTADVLEPEEIEFFRDLAEGPKPQRILSVSAGAQWSAARTDTGLLYVWGRNDQGQLGLGEESMGDLYSSERYPRIVGILAQENLKMAQHECGDTHIAALAQNGAMYSWGSRTWLEPRALTVPAGYANSLPPVRSVHAGLDYSFALTEQGVLYVIGRKSSGCLGTPSPKTAHVPRHLPPTIFNNEKVVALACGSTRCLAITDTEALVAESQEEQAKLQEQNPGVPVELVECSSFE